jgi:hypothetical protein
MQENKPKESVPPEPFKPCRIGGRVSHGVLSIPVSQLVLNQPRVRALVGEGEAARLAQHVRVRVIFFPPFWWVSFSIAFSVRSSVAERYNSCRQYRYNGVAHIPLEQPDETPDPVPAR